MDYYIHQSWGRIRIKIPALKNDRSKINQVKKTLLRQDGINKVTIHLITGSIAVYFDPCIQSSAQIINLFNYLGLLPNVVGFPGPFKTMNHSCQQLNVNDFHTSTSEWLGEVSRYIFKTFIDLAIIQTSRVLLRKNI